MHSAKIKITNVVAYHEILVWNICGPVEAADGFGSGRWAVGSRITVPLDCNKHQVCTQRYLAFSVYIVI